jgi:xylulokinase
VLEGVGYGVRHHLEIMRELDAAPLRIVAVGGGTQSDLWAQIVSDIAGITQLIPARTIGASYGDAMLAGLAVGVIDSVEELADGWTRIARTVEPNPANAAVYDEGYGIYRDLYENTKGQLHALARMGNTPKALTSP